MAGQAQQLDIEPQLNNIQAERRGVKRIQDGYQQMVVLWLGGILGQFVQAAQELVALHGALDVVHNLAVIRIQAGRYECAQLAPAGQDADVADAKQLDAAGQFAAWAADTFGNDTQLAVVWRQHGQDTVGLLEVGSR